MVTADAVCSFQRAAELGSALQEAWLVANAAVYLLNHSLGGAEGRRKRSNLGWLADWFRPLLAAARQVQLQG